MTHVENLIGKWRSQAKMAASLDDGLPSPYRPYSAGCRARARLHRQHASELEEALRRDRRDPTDDFDGESNEDRAERLAEEKADHDFEHKGEGR